MTIRTVVTRGYGNGTFSGAIALVVTRGYGIGAAVAVVAVEPTGGWHDVPRDHPRRETAAERRARVQAMRERMGIVDVVRELDENPPTPTITRVLSPSGRVRDFETELRLLRILEANEAHEKRLRRRAAVFLLLLTA